MAKPKPSCVGADHRAGTDLRLRPDHRPGVDGHVVLETGRRMDRGAGRHAGGAEARQGPHRRRVQTGKRLGEHLVGLRRHKGDGARRNPAGEALRDEAGAGLGRAQHLGVFRVVHIDEIVRSGGLERRGAGDRRGAAGAVRQVDPGEGRDVGDAQRLGAREEVRFGHGDLRREIRQRQGPALRRGLAL
jgi:hypothetical protein